MQVHRLPLHDTDRIRAIRCYRDDPVCEPSRAARIHEQARGVGIPVRAVDEVAEPLLGEDAPRIRPVGVHRGDDGAFRASAICTDLAWVSKDAGAKPRSRQVRRRRSIESDSVRSRSRRTAARADRCGTGGRADGVSSRSSSCRRRRRGFGFSSRIRRCISITSGRDSQRFPHRIVARPTDPMSGCRHRSVSPRRRAWIAFCTVKRQGQRIWIRRRGRHGSPSDLPRVRRPATRWCIHIRW